MNTSVREPKTVRLGDVAQLVSGYTFSSQDFGLYGTPVIKLGNITNGKVEIADEVNFTGDVSALPENIRIGNGDILIAMTGGGSANLATAAGRVGMYIGDRLALMNQRVGKIAASGIDPKFLYFFLSQDKVTAALANLSNGSAQSNLTVSHIQDLQVPFPDPAEQKRVALFLWDIDQKIELNRKMNKTLEEMGQTLFRHYFMDSPEAGGWEQKPLDEIANVAIGRTPPRKEEKWFTVTGEGMNWISIKDMGNTEGPYIFDTAERLTKDAVQVFRIPIIPKGTVVLSFKMTVGRVSITTDDMLSNEAIAHFKLKDGFNIDSSLLYLALKNFHYGSLGSTSSIVTAVNSASIKSIRVLLPDDKTFKLLKPKLDAIFDQMRMLQTKNRTLIQIRDSLLPRLISGKISV